jgi:hypothetical protein
LALPEMLSPAGTEVPDRPIRNAPGERPLLAIPSGDPIEAQKMLCLATMALVQATPPGLAQLDQLFALERQGQSVSKLLLTRYVEGDGRLRAFDWRAWQAAIRLCHAFYQAYEHFLGCIRGANDATWARHEPDVLVQLFQHRKIEFLLRFFRYKKRNPGQWKELHAMYLRAHEADQSNRTEASAASDTGNRVAGKLEQQYLQILLLEAMNSGQFSPREAWWAHRWFARWCNGSGLRLTRIDGGRHERLSGFVVDPSGSEGLQRAPVTADSLLYLDSSPLCAMIEQEVASLREGAAPLQGVTTAVRVGQRALLDKLAVLFAPIAPEIERRGERKAIDLTVQAVAGFHHIVDELRKERQGQAGSSPQMAASEGEVSISSYGQTRSRAMAGSNDTGPASLSMTALLAAIPQTWQVKDRSDSGCRMRGQVDNLNRVIPGSLIAIRDSATAPWTLCVVRRFRRLMVDHVEIGVEYLGRKPRYVKLVADGDPALPTDGAPDKGSRCFAALFLPPSEQLPRMPIKTLLLPVREYKAGKVVTLLSSNATYRMRLNESLQQQFEFVLTSFSVIEKSAPQRSAVQPTSRP